MSHGLLLSAAAATGCTSTNLGEILQAAGKDPATVYVSVSTPYGFVRVFRSIPEPHVTLTVAPDGTISIRRE